MTFKPFQFILGTKNKHAISHPPKVTQIIYLMNFSYTNINKCILLMVIKITFIMRYRKVGAAEGGGVELNVTRRRGVTRGMGGG